MCLRVVTVLGEILDPRDRIRLTTSTEKHTNKPAMYSTRFSMMGKFT